MKSLFILFICSAILASSVTCGHIWSHPITSEWQNAGHLWKLVLHFSVETPISQHDYLVVGSPKDLGSLTATLHEGSTQSTLSAQKSASSHDYFLSGHELKANQLYKLELTLATPFNNAGVQGIFRVVTTSKYEYANAIIYDSNPTFAVWTVAGAPGALAVGPVTTESQVSTHPSAEYNVVLDITSGVDASGFPNHGVTGGSQIIGTLHNDFSATACDLLAYICPSGQNPCTSINRPASYTCQVNNGGFVVTINSNVALNQVLRLQLTLKNPLTPGAGSLDLLHTTLNSHLIWELETGIALSTVSLITTTVSAFKTLWNVPYAENLACPIGLYQPGSVSGGVPVANNLFAEFSFDKSVGGQELGLIVELGPGSHLQGVLEGSIYHTGLVAVENGQITCAANHQSAVTQGLKIVCRGIASVQQGTAYGIGARVYASAYNAGATNTLSNFPKVTLCRASDDALISDTGSFAGYNAILNQNVVASGNKNAGSFADANSQKIVGTNWALAYKRAESTNTAIASITAAQQRTVLCLKYDTQTLLSASSADIDCSTTYTYGVYKDISSANEPNSIVLLINAAEAANSITLPALQQNLHYVHKFITHKDFVSASLVSGNSFGLNLVGDVFGSAASGGTETCGNFIPNPQGDIMGYCYHSFDSADPNFTSGLKKIGNAPNELYLLNKFDASDANFAVITVTCVAATNLESGRNCAFKSADRTADNTDVAFPGFELVSDAATVRKVAKSSYYADEQVRDWVYCLYTVPLAQVGTNGQALSTLNVGNAGSNGIVLVWNALLNWFHIDVPAEAANVSSQIYFLNANCYENTAVSNQFSTNDGTHIPVLLRVKYDITGVSGTFDGAALFFSHGSGTNFASSATNSGTFNNGNKGIVSNDLKPSNLNANFHQLATSNSANAASKVNAHGYGLVVAAGGAILANNELTWNYQKSIVFDSNSLSTDFYVSVGHYQGNNPGLCNLYYQLSNVVLALLQKKQDNTGFYNVLHAVVIYHTRQYTGGTYYSSKNALNLGAQASKNKQGNDLVWEKYSLGTADACAASTDLYPITTDYQIGVDTTLKVSTQTGSADACKLVNLVNGGYLGSAFTISVLTNLNQPNVWIKSVVQSTGIAVDTKCLELNLPSQVYSFNSQALTLQALVCQYQGTAQLDLSVNTNNFDIELNNPVPWYWGKHVKATAESVLQQVFTFGWSNQGLATLGVGQKYGQNSPANALVADSCTAGAYSNIFLNTYTQKIGFDLTNKQADLVLPLQLPWGANLINNNDQAITIHDEVGVAVSNFLEIYDCSSSIDNTQCTASVANAPTLKFHIASTSNTAQTVVAKNTAFSVSYIASFTGTQAFTNQVHKTNVFAFQTNTLNSGNSEVQILSCPISGTAVTSLAARSSAVGLTNIQFSRSNSIHSPFSFQFSLANGLGFYEGSNARSKAIITLTLGSLWNTANVADNVRCSVWNSQNQISHDFSSLQKTGSTEFTLNYKQTSDNPGPFVFKCSGGLSPANNNTDLGVSVSNGNNNLASSTVKIPTGGDQLVVGSLNSLSSSTKFATAGFHSVISFVANAATDIVAGQSTLYLHFPSMFNPKLSSHGHPSVYVDETLVKSWFVGDHHLAFNPKANVQNGTEFTVSVAGVDYPVGFGSYSSLTFQIDNDGDLNNGINEQFVVTAAAVQNLPTVNAQIPVLHYSVNSTNIRSKAKHTLYAKLEANSVAANKFLYLFFSEVWAFTISESQSISVCSLVNEYEAAGTNYASACTKIGDRIIKVALTEDAANTVGQIYKLEVGVFDTPQNHYVASFAPVLALSSDENAVSSFTSTGLANATAVNYNSPQGQVVLNWVNDQSQQIQEAHVFKGYFGAGLSLSGGAGFKSQGFNFVKGGNYAANFKVWQVGSANEVVKFKTGQSSTSFGLAALGTFNSGLALLKWTKTESFDNNISEIGNLAILVDNTKCQVTVQVANSNIPVSTTTQSVSLPVCLNFGSCLPIDSVTVNYALSVNTDNLFSLSAASTELTNNYDGKNQQACFQVSAAQNAATAKTATVDLTLTGPASSFYTLSQSSVTFTTEGAPAPVDPEDVTVATQAGSATLTINCKQLATIYYAAGAGITQATLSSIQASTSGIGVQKSRTNDYSATEFGWFIQDSLSAQTLQLSHVRSAASYKAFVYCVPQGSVSGLVKTVEWTQANVNALTTVLSIQLNGVPTQQDNIHILNGIATTLSNTNINDAAGNSPSVGVSRLLQLTGQTESNFNYIVLIHGDQFGTNNDASVQNLAAVNGKSLQELGVNTQLGVQQVGLSSAANVATPLSAPTVTATINATAVTWNSTVLVAESSSDFFIYACVFFKNQTAPGLSQLRVGQTGESQACQVKVQGAYIPANTSQAVQLKYLAENQEYRVTYSFGSINVGTSGERFSSLATSNFTTPAQSFGFRLISLLAALLLVALFI